MPPNTRCCISCRRTAHKSEFIRVVRCHPDQNIVLDGGMGRSAYLCPTLACLQLAQKKDRLSRALRRRVPASLYSALLERVAT